MLRSSHTGEATALREEFGCPKFTFLEKLTVIWLWYATFNGEIKNN